MNNNKRKLVRHVDGRIMIGKIPWKSFIIVAMISIGIFSVTIIGYNSTDNPLIFMLGVIGIGTIVLLFSELNNKETGIDIIKAVIKYKMEGDLYYERGNKINESTDIRCTWNKIQKEERGTDF